MSANTPILQIIILALTGLIGLSVAALVEIETPAPAFSSIDRHREKILSEGRNAAYQDIINPITNPILLVRDAKVAAANAAAQQLLGDHIVGEDVRIAIRHPAAAERLANSDAEHTGKPILLVGVGTADQRWELRIHGLNNGLKLVQLSDQTSRYAAERMRTDFVANASHELRTPLAAVKGFVETLQSPEAGNDPETRSRFLDIMLEETERMQRLVGDLMSLSRIEAEKYQLPAEPMDLGELVEEVSSFFASSKVGENHSFPLNIAEDIPMIKGDRAQLSQLLHNLITNACKYGRTDTPVTITIEPTRSGAMLRLSVSDKGDGIETDHIPRLTERFYRIDKGRSKAIGGTGLGLSIVKHIAERHGGRMEIASELGVGTKVSIFLPVTKNAGPRPDTAKLKPQS